MSRISPAREADKAELGRLVVLEHPGIGQPVTLEVLPSEIEGLKTAERVVRVEYYAPGAKRPELMSVRVDDFNALAQGDGMDAVLQRAVIATHAEGGQSDGRRRGRGTAARRGKFNYASLEHAGEPHRGRITEAEKELVRANLAAVNERLAAKGLRTIDQGNAEHVERYGLAGG